MENSTESSLSWKVVILFLIFFWPIGLLLLFRKVNSDKSAALQTSAILNIIGLVFAVFAAAYVDLGVTGKMTASDSIVATLFCGTGCILILYGAKKIRKNAEKFKKYISIVINNNQTSIDNIAAAIPTNYEQAKKDLQKMIDKGYFKNAYIDVANREITFPQKQNSQTVNQMENNIQCENQSNVLQQPRVKVVICKNCGANNQVTEGNVCECEYCGSPLE